MGFYRDRLSHPIPPHKIPLPLELLLRYRTIVHQYQLPMWVIIAIEIQKKPEKPIVTKETIVVEGGIYKYIYIVCIFLDIFQFIMDYDRILTYSDSSISGIFYGLK